MKYSYGDYIVPSGLIEVSRRFQISGFAKVDKVGYIRGFIQYDSTLLHHYSAYMRHSVNNHC